MPTDEQIEAAVSLIMKRRGIAIENGVMRAALAAADALAPYDPKLGEITERDRENAREACNALPRSHDAVGRRSGEIIDMLAEWSRKIRYEAVMADRAARSVAPAGVPDGWNLVPEGDNACMGSPLDALRYVLDSWREWTKYTGPLMGLPKELDERDAREREARSRLAHAAGTLSWHLDKSPSLVAMIAAAPSPPDAGWRPIASAPKGDPSRFDGPELLLGSIEGVHKGYWCHGDSQQPPGWIWDGDRDPTHWQPVPAAPPEE